MNEEKKEIKQDTHKKLKRPFLESKGTMFKKQEEVQKLKEFVLLLMKNNGHSDFIEGIQAGEFYLKSVDGKQEKSIMLSPKKLTTFNYNGQYFKGWVAHEDNMSPYPEEPLHNGEMFRKTTQKIAMNYKDANEAKYLEAKTKMWLYVMIGGAIIIYIIYIVGKNAGWFNDGGNEGTVTKTVAETVKNGTEILNNTGVRVQ